MHTRYPKTTNAVQKEYQPLKTESMSLKVNYCLAFQQNLGF